MKRKWVSHLAFSNIKKHMKRNFFSVASLVIGLTSSFLIIGFSNNAKQSVINQSYRQFDYGSLTITKEIKTESKNGGLSIVRNNRPSLLEMQGLNSQLDHYEVDINFDAILPNYLSITYQDKPLKDFTYECVYSFTEQYIDKNLLKEGEIPYRDTLNEVVINQQAYEQLEEIVGESPLNKTLHLYQESESIYYTDNEFEPSIVDYFIYDKEVTIVGVVDDLNFLSTPKIYYSYLALKDYLSVVYLNNLSTYFEKDISWIDRIDECSGADSISSYSYRLFLKNHTLVESVELDINNISEPFEVTCGSLTRSNALISLIDAATTGMEVFLIIALLGTSLIMGIVSFSFYSEDKKTIAILVCLGGKMSDVNDIYCTENMMIGLAAFLISISLAPLFQLLINLIIKSFSGFEHLIKIPFLSFMNIPLGLPIIVFVSTLLISILSTLLPIAFSKKISLKEELKDE